MAYQKPQYETPSRFTAINEHTGRLIMTGTDGDKEKQSLYNQGWDRIFNKNSDEEQ